MVLGLLQNARIEFCIRAIHSSLCFEHGTVTPVELRCQSALFLTSYLYLTSYLP